MRNLSDAQQAAVSSVLAGADSDQTYDRLCPMMPGYFAQRFWGSKRCREEDCEVTEQRRLMALGQVLSADELEACNLQGEPGEAFDKCYPDYLPRHEFRDIVAEARGGSEQTETPAE
jgi:hypothetical protein